MWNKAHSKIYQSVKKEAVWDLLIDVNNWPNWHANLEYCKMEGEFIVGNYFWLKPKKAPIAKVYIIEAEAYTHFADCTKFLGAKIYNTYTLEEIKGSLRLHHKILVTGILKWVWVILVAKNIAANIPGEMDSLVKLAKIHDE
jgi:hypothetical protein